MDHGLSAVLGALIGAAAGISGGICLEAFKRSRDARATALALASSIATNIWIVERRGHVQFFNELLPRIRAGESLQLLGLVNDDNIQDEVSVRYIDKIGLLPGNLGARVVRFFTILTAIRMDVVNLKAGRLGNVQSQARLIEQDLKMWEEEIDRNGRLLILDLQKFASRWWRSPSRQGALPTC